MSEKKRVAIIMGSDSDLEVMQEASKVLKEFGIGYEMKVMSAHRTPDLAADYAKNAEKSGIGVFIAGAGGAAHLPGVIAAFTAMPVIGIPIMTKSLGGLDSLLSIVQMPKGIPVATVAINGGANAGLLALQILSVADADLRKALYDYKERMKNEVIEKSKKVEAL